MKILSALPLSTTFVSPATIFTPAAVGRFSHGGNDLFEIGIEKALLQNITGGDDKGVGADHGEIVHRAADGQLSNVSAGKEDRADHIGVCRQGQSALLLRKDGGIAKQIEIGIRKMMVKQAARSVRA